jgi:hypothetical protein
MLMCCRLCVGLLRLPMLLPSCHFPVLFPSFPPFRDPVQDQWNIRGKGVVLGVNEWVVAPLVCRSIDSSFWNGAVVRGK